MGSSTTIAATTKTTPTVAAAGNEPAAAARLALEAALVRESGEKEPSQAAIRISTIKPSQEEFKSSLATSNCRRNNNTNASTSSNNHQPRVEIYQGPELLRTNQLLTQQENQQWFAQVASQTQQRMSQASDQLGHSLRQLCASASSIAAAEAMPPSYQNIPGIVPYYQGRSIGPPPSYDDVINPYAPPPTYQSLFGQMREARKSSRGLLDLLRRLLVILLSTLGCSLLLAFMILIPFTMIIVGALYLDECKIEHIPAFLLAGGLIWAAKNVLHCYAQCSKASLQEHSEALAAELYLAAASNSSNAATSSLSSSSSGAESTASSAESSISRLELNGAGGDGEQALAAELSANEAAAAAAVASTPFRDGQVTQLSGNQVNCLVEENNGELASNQELEAARRNRALAAQLRHEQRASRFKSSVCESLLNCILVGWFIAGCVIVLRNYEPDFLDPTSPRYCHKTVYMYTFWLVSSALLALALFLGCVCCLMVSSALANRQADLDLA